MNTALFTSLHTFFPSPLYLVFLQLERPNTENTPFFLFWFQNCRHLSYHVSQKNPLQSENGVYMMMSFFLWTLICANIIYFIMVSSRKCLPFFHSIALETIYKLFFTRFTIKYKLVISLWVSIGKQLDNLACIV